MYKISKNRFMEIKRMNQDTLNGFLNVFYEQAFLDGVDHANKEMAKEVRKTIKAEQAEQQLTKDELFKELCKVSGVGMNLANKIVKHLEEIKK